MEEVEHVTEVLLSAKKAIKEGDSVSLRNLSDQTIHSASTNQDGGSIALAVIIYALSKLIERGDNYKIKKWPIFIKRFNSDIDFCISSLKSKRDDLYIKHLRHVRIVLTNAAVNIKPYIEDVYRKASLNKASKIYEHGISLGQTAKLLGVMQWELAEYTSRKQIQEAYTETLNVKKRIATATEFFS